MDHSATYDLTDVAAHLAAAYFLVDEKMLSKFSPLA